MRLINHLTASILASAYLLMGATSCSLTAKYTVGGNLAGLLGTGLVLANNGGDELTFTGNGSFAFKSGVKNTDAYSVTVVTQPTNPIQTCTVRKGSGTIDKADVTNVLVTCTQAGRFAFVANQAEGDVSAYAIDTANGALVPVVGSPFASLGTGPVALAVEPNGRYLYVVNGASNDVSVFQIDYNSGALTREGQSIPTGNTPTAIAIDPGNRFLFVTNSVDDSVSAYTLSSGVATAVSGSPYAVGHTPVAAKVDPTGTFLYVTNYADGTVSAFAIDGITGVLSTVAGSPFGAGTGAGAIAIDPTDQYAYVANETGGSLSAYSLNSTTGALVPVSGSPFSTGSSPESVAINPAGSYIYAANVTVANEVAGYAITPSTGALTLGPSTASGIFPLSVVVDPGGLFVYAANDASNDVSVYSADATTGVLTEVSGSPFAAGAGARSIAIF